jgi:RHS repeat-associated protein
VLVGLLGVLAIAISSPAQTPPSGYAGVIYDDNPAGYWRLGEASGPFADSSPTGNHPGAVSLVGSSNGSSFFRAQPGGIVGDDGAVRDDSAPSGFGQSPNGAAVAVSSNGGCVPDPALEFGNRQAFALEAWIRPQANGATYKGGVIGNYTMDGSGSYNVGHGLYVNWPSLSLSFVRADGGGGSDTISAPVAAQAWSHVVASYDGSTMALYVNGALVQQTASTRNLPTAACIIRMGQFSFDFGVTDYPGYFYGSIDEGAAYKRALTAQEVADHYAAGIGALSQAARQSFGTRGKRGIHALTASVPISDPVNTLTGAFTESVEDLSLPGTGVPFAWTRSYTSADPTVGRLGPGWTDSYAVSLAIAGDGDVTLHGDEGQQVEYARQGDGSFVGAPGARSKFEPNPPGYKLTRQDQVVYLFDAQGRATRIEDRNGEGVTLAYDGQGRLATTTDAANRQVTVSYNASNLVSQVATQDGRSVAFGYTSGRLTSVTDVRGKTWTYTYDAGGRLATIVDPLSHTQVTNVYGADGRVTSQTDALGKTTTFAWNGSTETATITDPNNHVWKDDYQGEILLSRIDPLTNSTGFGHDGDLNESSVTGPTGEPTSMTYDARGNLLTATAPPSLGGAQKTFVYNARNDPTQITDARGKVTSYTYEADGNVATVTQDGTQVGSYTYDPAGRVLTVTDGNGKTTTNTYFPTTGYLESSTDPLGNKTTYTYDAAGRVLTRVDPRGNCSGCTPANFTWTYTYNAAGQVLTETNPLGQVTTHTYDDAGNELTVTDANGKTTTYAYDAANRLQSVTAPDGGATSYTYDDAGNKLTETDPLNHTTTHTYTAANQLASTTTASGAKTTFFYDANGNLVKQVEPRGNVAGANPDDYDTLYTYDAAGRLLTETDPLGNVTTHTNDAVGNELTLTDANGKTTTSTYDGKHRLSTVTAPDGGVTTYTYDPVGNKLTEKDPRNNTTTFVYDDANRLVSVTKPSGGKTTYGYDPNGNQTSMVEPRGNVAGCGCAAQYTWTYAYDRANRKLSETSPLGHTTSSTYDAVGNLVTRRDAKGHALGWVYDDANRLVQTYAANAYEDAVLASSPSAYWHLDETQGPSAADASGSNRNGTYYTSGVTYAVQGALTPPGLAASFASQGQGFVNVGDTLDFVGRAPFSLEAWVKPDALDTNGRRVIAKESTDFQTAYLLYVRSNGIGFNRRALGVDDNTFCTVALPTTSFSHLAATYDGATLRIYLNGSLCSQNGSTRDLVDHAGPLRIARASATALMSYFNGAIDEPAVYSTALSAATVSAHYAARTAAVTTYTYDLVGNLTQRRDARNNTTTYAYDVDNRRTSVTNPLAKVWTTAYDPAGNVSQTVDANGNATPAGGDGQTSYTYDRAGRLTATDYSDATPDVTFTYDAVGNRLTMVDGQGTETRTYDPVNRLLTVTRGSDTFSYTYDQTGNLLTRTYPGSFQTTYTYDVDSRLATAVADALTTSYAYDAAGNVVTTTLPSASSLTEARVYDRSGRLTEVNTKQGATVRARFVVTRDAVGNPTRVDRTGSLTQTQTYAYDVNDRLTSVCFQASCPGGTDPKITWTYDAVGNRLSQQRTSGTTSYTYNAADQLLSAGSTSYSYDANGNELSAGTRTFSYDLANRLKTTTSGTTTTTYASTGDGVRAQASTGSAASAKTNFLWDVSHELPQLALERDGSNVLQRRYTYGLRRLRQATGTASYYAYDALGSVAGLLSSSGAAQRSWTYEPYGSIYSSSGSSPANFVQFTGEYLDPTGLYHLRARQYDPTSGRFLRPDPVETPLASSQASAYAYASNGPTMSVDPSGLTAQAIQATNSQAPAARASSEAPSVGPREAWYSIPRWSRRGTYHGGLFIQQGTICPFVGGIYIPGFVPCLRGDSRGFSPNAPRSAYRAYMSFDFANGQAYFRINPTCETGGECHRPHEIESFRPWWDLRDLPDRSNRIGVRVSSSAVEFKWSLVNSGLTLPRRAIPAVDGSITFGKSGETGIDLDGFPSFELYRRSATGLGTTCVFQVRERSKYATVLPPVFGLGEGRSRC